MQLYGHGTCRPTFTLHTYSHFRFYFFSYSKLSVSISQQLNNCVMEFQQTTLILLVKSFTYHQYYCTPVESFNS